jgi:hypothetical protein
MAKKGKTSLYAASRQWAERPADQRFWTLEELLQQTREYAEESAVEPVQLSRCEVVPIGDDLVLETDTGYVAEFQNYSFGQLCTTVAAPTSYLRELPAQLAADNLNHGLTRVGGQQHILLHQNGGTHLRCITSKDYARIWNYEVAELALALQEQEGWRTPPARPCGISNVPTRTATKADILRKSAHPSLGIRVGDTISPAGLYASDRDCFIFQINEDVSIEVDGETMFRGVFWSNSEVGDAKWRGTFFLYDSVCGNHIVWGAKVVADIQIVHKGNAREAYAAAMAGALELMEASASDDVQRIKMAKALQLGGTRDEVVTKVFRMPLQLSRTDCESAYVLAERHSEEHGNNPNSAWGYAAGLTRLSQGQYADRRNMLDRAAGRILEVAL